MASYSSSSKNQKNCSTCEYWKGIRSLVNNGLQIQFPATEKYPCSNRIASRKEFTSGIDLCNKWVKWKLL